MHGKSTSCVYGAHSHHRLVESRLRAVEAREAALVEKLKQAEAELAARQPSGVYIRHVLVSPRSEPITLVS